MYLLHIEIFFVKILLKTNKHFFVICIDTKSISLNLHHIENTL